MEKNGNNTLATEKRVTRLGIIDLKHDFIMCWVMTCGDWWLIGRFGAFCPKDRGFESLFSRHVGTLGKSFTHSCLWRFGMELRHNIRAVSGAPLSSSGLEEAL